MKIINGFNYLMDFKEASTTMDKFEAWKTYVYLPNRHMYDHQLKYLYCSTLESFEPFVTNFNIDKKIEHFKNQLDAGLEQRIKRTFDDAVDYYDLKEDFDVFIMSGFGHANGMAGLGEKPFVYIGSELIDEKTIDTLIFHEFNHMVRLASDPMFYKLTFENWKVIDLVILEGLGTVAPMVRFNNHQKSKNYESITLNMALMVAEDTFGLLEQSKEVYLRWLKQHRDDAINFEILKELFYSTSNERIDDKPVKIGYYLGSIIVLTLLDNGYAFQELTIQSADEIYSNYLKIVDK